MTVKIIKIWEKKENLLKILLLINISSFSDFLSSESLENDLNL